MRKKLFKKISSFILFFFSLQKKVRHIYNRNNVHIIKSRKLDFYRNFHTGSRTKSERQRVIRLLLKSERCDTTYTNSRNTVMCTRVWLNTKARRYASELTICLWVFQYNNDESRYNETKETQVEQLVQVPEQQQKARY